MSNSPLVSIIIPTFNRAQLIEETLDSVSSQTYHNWECIVVDDGSSDQTDKVLAKYIDKDSRFKFFKRPDDHLPGGNGARNYGFQMSRGDYIQWFDSDDLMNTNYLSFKIDHINGHDLLITSGVREDINGNLSNLRLNFKKGYSLYKEVVSYNSEIITQTVLFKRHALLDFDLFNENILRGQETEFFGRLFFKKKLTYIVMDEQLFTYRVQDDSKSSQEQSRFLPSRLIFSLDNLERCLSISDFHLADRFYKKTIAYLFEFIKLNDRSLFSTYHKKLMATLKDYDITINFLKFLPALSIIKLHSERSRKFFLNQNIK